MFNPLSDQELISKLKIKPGDKVLDVGGSGKQHQLIKIDTILDLVRPEEKDYTPSILRAKHFVQLDITKDKFPFKDKSFDVVLCTHTLEDLTDPYLAISEMSRVGKRGYIATPHRGQDMVFDHLQITEWNIGPVRQPGLAHHKWLFELRNKQMYIVPKNYPILYSRDFQFVKWNGPDEFRYFWQGKIDFQIYYPLSHHKLIKEYNSFVQKNRSKFKKGLVSIYLDSPWFIVKEWVKKIIKRGVAYQKDYSFKE